MKQAEPYFRDGKLVDPLDSVSIEAPQLPAGREFTLREKLLDKGFSSAEADGIEADVHREAMMIAVESFRHLVRKLGDTAGGLAVQRVLLGADKSQRADAAAAGCSLANFQRREADVRARLGMK